MKTEQLRINSDRLMQRIHRLAEIGFTEEGACCRLALTDEDKAGRDLVVGWMRELGLQVQVDPIGNIFGLRAGLEDSAPVMTGSHIDTVRTGGRYMATMACWAVWKWCRCSMKPGLLPSARWW